MVKRFCTVLFRVLWVVVKFEVTSSLWRNSGYFWSRRVFDTKVQTFWAASKTFIQRGIWRVQINSLVRPGKSSFSRLLLRLGYAPIVFCLWHFLNQKNSCKKFWCRKHEPNPNLFNMIKIAFCLVRYFIWFMRESFFHFREYWSTR